MRVEFEKNLMNWGFSILKLPNTPDLFARIDPRWNGFIYTIFAIFFDIQHDTSMVILSLLCGIISAVMANVGSIRFYYVNDIVYISWASIYAKALIDHDMKAFGILLGMFTIIYITMRIIRERTSMVKTYQWKWPMNFPD